MLAEVLLPRATRVADERFGPYEILGEIGEGGTSVVYLAEQILPIRREVALKAIKPAMVSRAVIARAETERQSMALMEHPNIARIIDAGTSSAGRPFFVMEFVDGLPITQFCDLHKLDVPRRAALLADVCRAVEYAHSKGVLHRDLKPSNILVAGMSERAMPKIIDFGIAKTLAGQLRGLNPHTEAGQLLGTLEYMSPEQADLSNRAPRPEVDVYSLGVILYELVCGVTPLRRERLEDTGIVEILRIIREEEPPAPAERLRGLGPAAETAALHRSCTVAALQRVLSGDLAAILQKALAKDGKERYCTAADFANDLERYLRNEPVHARSAGPFYRWRKLAQRHRSGIIATSAALAAVLSLAAAVIWQSGSKSSAAIPKVTPLTSYRGYEFDPAFSPDGKQFAFVWNGDGKNW